MRTRTVITWNINGIRARIDHVLGWLENHKPDVLCLQETKVEDGKFPEKGIRGAGYQAVFAGQKAYNGVAILSRLPVSNLRIGFDGSNREEQKRLIAATVGDVTVVNAYIPNGQALDSPKYPEKLEFLKQLRGYFERWHKPSQNVVLVGDFNIAADERDVFSVEEMEGQIHFSEPERQALEYLRDWGFVDIFRKFVSEGGHFSWWDFRQAAFRRNRGLRIDHIWATPGLAERFTGCWIAKEERAKEKPSDHAPVVAELASLD
jgi:exodeoxyribonuclease-3